MPESAGSYINSCQRHDGPFPRQHQATRTISAVPRAENRFISAMRIWVSRGDAVAEGLEAAHFRFDPASDMVSGPSLPECSFVVPGGGQSWAIGRMLPDSPLSMAAHSCGWG